MTHRFITHILLPDSVDHLSLKDLEICSWSVMRDKIDPEFSAPFLRHSLDFLLLQRRHDVVIGAIRNPHELSILQSYILSQSCIPYCISIQRPGITSLNTDVDQPKLLSWCLTNLPSEQCFNLSNSRSLEHLTSNIDLVLPVLFDFHFSRLTLLLVPKEGLFLLFFAVLKKLYYPSKNQ